MNRMDVEAHISKMAFRDRHARMAHWHRTRPIDRNCARKGRGRGGGGLGQNEEPMRVFLIFNDFVFRRAHTQTYRN